MNNYPYDRDVIKGPEINFKLTSDDIVDGGKARP